MQDVKLRELIGDARTIGIAGHIHPDGDSLGSSMALALAIEAIDGTRRVDLFSENVPPEIAKHLPYPERFRTDSATDVASYDLFISADTAPDRIGPAEAYHKSARRTLNIDHHMSNPGGCMVNIVDPKASSCCEVVYGLLEEELLTEEIARALYIGIMTDTGVFKYSNTSETTMRIAGRLMRFGLNTNQLVNDVFFTRTLPQQKILAEALRVARPVAHGKGLISVLFRDSFELTGATDNDTEGIASQLKQTEGAEAIAFIHQLSDGDFRVSFRSGDAVNVSELAQRFGGGGHIRASGCTLKDPQQVYAVEEALVRALEEN